MKTTRRLAKEFDARHPVQVDIPVFTAPDPMDLWVSGVVATLRQNVRAWQKADGR